MACKSIAKSLVNFEFTGTETTVYRENADKAVDILVSDIADSTGSRYGPHWVKFSEFYAENGKENLPSSVTDICVYLTFISARGFSAVLMARASIRYFNLKFNLATWSPTDDKKVANLVLGLWRRIGKSVQKREPIQHEVVLKVIKNFLPEGILSDQILIKFRWANFFSLMYFCSARYEEVAHLDIGNITFTDSYNVKLNFWKAKNN